MEGTDPERIAQIANTIVEEFQGYITEQATQRATETSSEIDAQVALLQEQVADLDAQIADLNETADADDVTAQQQITDLVEQRAELSQTLTELRATSLTFNTEMLAASARVEMADPALVPTEPFAPRVLFSTLLGVFVGFLLGIGLVALLEFMDNTIKPDQNIQELTGAPVLATISQLPRLKPGSAQVFTIGMPQANASEAMRLLRTNLDFAAASGLIAALTVTSPGAGEGKSTTVANLGVVMAQAGMTAAIIDADLRKPTQSRIFGVPNDTGLTRLLTHPDQNWRDVAHKVALPGLFLIPSGPLPPNPADLVSSARFEAILERIKGDVDLVILDSPPILSASDSLAIATHTDGVVLVCHSHKTRIDALQHAAQSVHRGGIRLVGVVLNRQKGQQGASYYGEYYGAAAEPVVEDDAQDIASRRHHLRRMTPDHTTDEMYAIGSMVILRARSW